MTKVDLVTLLLRNLGRFKTEYIHPIDPDSNHEIQMDMIFERLRKLVPDSERYTSSSNGSRLGRVGWERELRLDYSFGIPLLSVGYDEQDMEKIVVRTPLFREEFIKQEIRLVYDAGIN